MPGSILQGRKLPPGEPTGRLSRLVGRLRPWAADAATGEVTYSVGPPPGRQDGQDRRRGPRRPVRLQSGKIVDSRHRFIVECVIRQRSAKGARLAMARPAQMPDRIGLFDDAEQSIRTAEIVWQRGLALGIRFTPELDRPVKQATLAGLAGKFYAVAG